MIKVKTTGQILPFKKRHGFAQSISSAWLCMAVFAAWKGLFVPIKEEDIALTNLRNPKAAMFS
jgi:hypothetical protein